MKVNQGSTDKLEKPMMKIHGPRSVFIKKLNIVASSGD
jgi:hypothetical protein